MWTGLFITEFGRLDMITVRKKQIIPYFLIALFCMTVFMKPLISGDEFWNYSFAKNIANGMLPYRDFNIVQTPLSAYLSGLFLWIFGEGIIVYRVFGYIVALLIFGILFHLCKKISKSAFLSFLITMFVYALHYPYYIYNYNYLSILILLVVFELEIADSCDVKWKQYMIGLLSGLSVLSKQNTGALIVLGNFTVSFYYILRKKFDRRIMFGRMLLSLVPMLIYSFILLISGTFGDFWEYAINGIGTFTHRKTPIDLLVSGPGNLVYMVVIVSIYYLAYKKIKKGNKNSSFIAILDFNVVWTAIIYPLCDVSHMICILIPMMPLMLFCIDIKPIRDWESYVCVFITVFISACAIIPFMAIGDNYMISDIPYYRGVYIDVEVNQTIDEIADYINDKYGEGYNVRIANAFACAYMIPLDRYEKNWSMLLVGNIGDSTTEKLLDDDKSYIYLVLRDSSGLNAQDYFELIDYIKENYVKVGEVQKFDVYEAPY